MTTLVLRPPYGRRDDDPTDTTRFLDQAVHLADDIWVVHAFQKKSTQGIKTPTREVDLIKDRLKRLKELLG
jgi:phage-related protein